MGIPYLSTLLNQTFMAHTKKNLPMLKDSINTLVSTKQYEMSQYGELLFEANDNVSKGLFILNLISKFNVSYSETITGTSMKQGGVLITGGARIFYIINETFKNKILDINPFDVLTDEDIRTTIYNASGLKPSLFLPENAFELLVKQQIARLLDPCLEICQIIHDELRKIVLQINIPELARFEPFSLRINQTMEKLLKERLKPTVDMVKNLIEVQMGFINTVHPNFMSGAEALISNVSKENEKQKEEQKKEVNPKEQAPKIKEISVEKREEKNSGGFFSFFGARTDVDQKIHNLNKSVSEKNDMDEDIQQYGRGVLKPPQSEITLAKKNYDHRDKISVETTKRLLQSYFDFVKRDVTDLVIKTIVTFLIESSRSQCERYLVAHLYKESLYDDLLCENKEIAIARKECYDTLKSLLKCQEVLEEIDAKL